MLDSIPLSEARCNTNKSLTSGVSPTIISLFLNGKRKLRPALAVRLVERLERVFVRKGSRLDTALFSSDRDE